MTLNFTSINTPIRKYGAYGYSIHPMFAINDKYNSYKDLPNAFITIEGHKEYQEKLKQLFLSLGNKVQIISKENKSLYSYQKLHRDRPGPGRTCPKDLKGK